MVSEEQFVNVEEQVVVDGEVLVHGGDLIPPPSSSDSGLLIPFSTCSNAVDQDQQSVAVVEAPGQAAAASKTLMWTYGRPAFYVNPAAVLSNVPTAVVAPIKREVPDADPQVLPDNAVEPVSNTTHTLSTPLSKAHLPPFETFRSHTISGGSISVTSSAPVTSSAGESSSSAMNLSLATRSTVKSDAAAAAAATEPLPLTSFYRQQPTSSSVAFPFPVWSLSTVGLPAEADTQPRLSADPQSNTTDQLVATTPLKPKDGHVTGQLLSVQQTPPVTVEEATASASRCFVSNNGNARN